jgi:hypothetical protein
VGREDPLRVTNPFPPTQEAVAPAPARRLPHLSLLLAVIVAAVVLLGTALPADASGQVNTNGAGAKFVSKGDKFYLWDTKCDGHSVYIEYKLDYRRKNGSTGGVDRWKNSQCGKMTSFNHNFAEKHTIWYKVCVEDWGTNTCSPFRQDRI